MGDFLKAMWPVTLFYGGAQLVNMAEFGGRYTYTAIAAAAAFFLLFTELQKLGAQLRMANRRLWNLANPGAPPEDNPYQE